MIGPAPPAARTIEPPFPGASGSRYVNIADQLDLELLKLHHLVAYRFDKAAVAGAMLT